MAEISLEPGDGESWYGDKEPLGESVGLYFAKSRGRLGTGCCSGGGVERCMFSSKVSDAVVFVVTVSVVLRPFSSSSSSMSSELVSAAGDTAVIWSRRSWYCNLNCVNLSRSCRSWLHNGRTR